MLEEEFADGKNFQKFVNIHVYSFVLQVPIFKQGLMFGTCGTYSEYCFSKLPIFKQRLTFGSAHSSETSRTQGCLPTQRKDRLDYIRQCGKKTTSFFYKHTILEIEPSIEYCMSMPPPHFYYFVSPIKCRGDVRVCRGCKYTITF